jgi:hypothetical protein
VHGAQQCCLRWLQRVRKRRQGRQHVAQQDEAADERRRPPVHQDEDLSANPCCACSSSDSRNLPMPKLLRNSHFECIEECHLPQEADLAASLPLGLMAMPLRTRSRSFGMP